MVVDIMFDIVNIGYGVFLICFYVICDGKVVYEGGFGLMGYDIKDVKRWFKRNCVIVLL